MIQIYRPYWLWEDWLSGMWSKLPLDHESIMLYKVIDFIGNHEKYGNAMNEVMGIWHNTMLNSLTNKSINRRAFIGQCAVCYKLGSPEYITRIAWKMLDDNQRKLADLQADKYIKIWEKEHMIKSINTLKLGKIDVTNTGYQMKLQMS